MELFDWYSVALWIGNAITSYRLTAMGSDPTVEQWIGMNLETMLYAGIAAIAFFLVTLIMGGIALNTMAKKAGRKPSALAYLPFGNTYFAGKLAGESNFFGQKMKRAGLYAMLVEILYSALEISRVVLNYMLNRPEYYTARKIAGTETSYWDVERTLIPENLRWQYDYLNYSQIVSYILLFLALVFLVTLFVAFFKKYYARGPVLMTLLCTILPFRGATIFAVRNNAPVDYNEYLRQRSPRPQPPVETPPAEDPFQEFDDDPFDLDKKDR